MVLAFMPPLPAAICSGLGMPRSRRAMFSVQAFMYRPISACKMRLIVLMANCIRDGRLPPDGFSTASDCQISMWHLAQVHLYAVALCLAAGTRLNEVPAVAAAQVAHLLHRLGLNPTRFTQVNDLQNF